MVVWGKYIEKIGRKIENSPQLWQYDQYLKHVTKEHKNHHDPCDQLRWFEPSNLLVTPGQSVSFFGRMSR